jgi:hypothetical protein
VTLAFFLLPTRAWELGIGASLALALPASSAIGGLVRSSFGGCLVLSRSVQQS